MLVQEEIPLARGISRNLGVLDVLAAEVEGGDQGRCADCVGSLFVVDDDGSLTGIVGTRVPCFCSGVDALLPPESVWGEFPYADISAAVLARFVSSLPGPVLSVQACS